jgi:tRNA-dihydrouridine synthase B
MKQFAAWFTHGVPGGGALRKQIFDAKKGAAVLEAVDDFFARRTEAAVADEDNVMAAELVAAGEYCD